MRLITKPYYLRGTAVRLEGYFYDWDDKAVIPSLITLKIYNSIWAQIESISVSPENRAADGAFYYDYVFDDAGTFYYEWVGEIDGTPSLDRHKIIIKQI